MSETRPPYAADAPKRLSMRRDEKGFMFCSAPGCNKLIGFLDDYKCGTWLFIGGMPVQHVEMDCPRCGVALGFNKSDLLLEDILNRRKNGKG
jgi:hypothetical protein